MFASSEQLKQEFIALLNIHTECRVTDFDEETFADQAVLIVLRERARVANYLNGSLDNLREFPDPCMKTIDGIDFFYDSGEGHD